MTVNTPRRPGWFDDRPPPSVLNGSAPDLGDERAALALRAEAERLERQQHGDRERVVDLRDVDVVGVSAGALERPRAGVHGGRLRERPHLVHRQLAEGLAPAEQVDALLRELLGLALRDHHEGAAGVGHDAAVEPVQRRRDHRRGEHVGDLDRVAEARVRVVRGVGPALHRDLRELLGRGAELVHVAASRRARRWTPSTGRTGSRTGPAPRCWCRSRRTGSPGCRSSPRPRRRRPRRRPCPPRSRARRGPRG